jgi:phosphocarrier protein
MSAERTVTVVPEDGLHARPAAAFVEAVNEHDASVEVGTPDDDLVAAGSMIAVTSLGVSEGDDVRLVADGDDATESLDALETILTTPEAELDA